MDIDPIDALSQSLKVAGIHPSQTDPVVLRRTTQKLKTHSRYRCVGIFVGIKEILK